MPRSGSGYRMPAEWERHEATWIAWPHERSDWPGKFAAIPWVFGEIVRHLAPVESVRILVADHEAEREARDVLRRCGARISNIQFFHQATDRSWTRDYCPIFVRDGAGQLVVTNWIFNGWAKYGDYHHDNQIPALLAEELGLPRVDPGVVLEGGSIDVNGAGVLLTTEECLLSSVQARNPHLGRAELEEIFAFYLGIEQTVWLRNGIAGDDTHGHVDDLARFVNGNTIVIAAEDDPNELNYQPLRENLDILLRSPFNVITLPMPRPVYFEGQRLPASYANFYIANEIVLVPTFNDPKDRIALNTLAAQFPGREVVGISCGDLILGLGALHCLTQQQPARN